MLSWEWGDVGSMGLVGHEPEPGPEPNQHLKVRSLGKPQPLNRQLAIHRSLQPPVRSPWTAIVKKLVLYEITLLFCTIVMDSRQEKHPTPIRSTPVSFLDLPRGVRNNIYKRLLVLQHPLHIFQEPNSPLESFVPDRPPRWLALLRTNRQVSTESRATLYSMNQFHLEDITPLQTDLLRSFLDCIGSLNAASIPHLCVNFPVAERPHGQADGIELRTDGLQSVRLCQDQCTNLATLETVVHYENLGFFRKPEDFL